jgi:preprotein translocase subunit SecA
MTQIDLNNQELWAIFEARRVKAPELRGPDHLVHAAIGWYRNHRRMLPGLKAAAQRVEALEPSIQALSAARFREEVVEIQALARRGRLEGEALDRAMALVREAVVRTLGLRPFPVQIMGALAMQTGAIAEMATGEGKTITAAMIAALWGLEGRPVHVITVNDYLVERDATEMKPIYEMMGLRVGFVVHETTPQERFDHYRRNIVYNTSKELVADFLRDQIALGTQRNAPQTTVSSLMGRSQQRELLVPGLFKVLVDEADSLLIDEAVTPLIISNSPEDNPNASLYLAADELSRQLVLNEHFTIDRTVRNIDLTERGRERLKELADHTGFWKGERRREELVTQALTAHHCYVRDEQYLIAEDKTVQIIDEFTGRVMADRSWRHGLHQAVEVKEGVPVTSDKENLARLSFQRFFRQYPYMAGMTGTAWESRAELWQIYRRPIIRIPTNRPCIRALLPTRMFDTAEQKWTAVAERVRELHQKGVPVLVGTRSVLASEEVSARLKSLNLPHRVLNATQTAQEASIVAEAGGKGRITVATNMAGRGTDIKLARGVAEIGGLHVVSTEPHASGRVDRQLFGRAARQGDPGSAQLFCSAEDDLFIRHVRRGWRAIGPDRLIKLAQANAERLARFNRKQVLKQDDWMDQTMPF